MGKEKKEGALVQREAMQPMTPFAEMERYFENFFRNPFSLLSQPFPNMPAFQKTGMISPAVDIYEDGDDVVVKAEIPGMKKEDIDVTITDNSLTISGEKKQEEEVKEKDYHRIERSYGSFSRSFRLPDNVKAGKAKASFKDGVLEIRLPKTKESKQKKIEIS